MLHHDHAVPRVPQLAERVDELDIIPLVQPDARFVEDVEHVDQLRPDLRRQPNPLALPAAERPRRARQRQVAQSHIHQEPQPVANLLEYVPRNGLLLFVESGLDPVEPRGELLDAHRREFGDVLSVDPEVERVLAQPRPAAHRTRPAFHILLLPLRPAFALFGLRFEVGDHPLPSRHTAVPRSRQSRHPQRRGVPVKQGVHRHFVQLVERRVEGEVVPRRQCPHLVKDGVGFRLPERLNPPLVNRLAAVRNDPRNVEHRFLAQSVAVRTGPLRRVERKGVRRRFIVRNSRRRTHQVPAVIPGLARLVVRHHHRPFPLPHRLFEALFDACFGPCLRHRPVDHQLDVVYFVAVELHSGMQFDNLAVHPRIEVPLLDHRSE